MRQKSFLTNFDICGLVPIVSKRVTGQRGCGVSSTDCSEDSANPAAGRAAGAVRPHLPPPARREVIKFPSRPAGEAADPDQSRDTYIGARCGYPQYQHQPTVHQCRPAVLQSCSVWISELPRPPRLLTLLPLPALQLIANTTTASAVPTSQLSTSITFAHMI